MRSPSLALVDSVYYSQGVFWDAAGLSSERLRLTNGLRIVVGAP